MLLVSCLIVWDQYSPGLSDSQIETLLSKLIYEVMLHNKTKLQNQTQRSYLAQLLPLLREGCISRRKWWFGVSRVVEIELLTCQKFNQSRGLGWGKFQDLHLVPTRTDSFCFHTQLAVEMTGRLSNITDQWWSW